MNAFLCGVFSLRFMAMGVDQVDAEFKQQALRLLESDSLESFPTLCGSLLLKHQNPHVGQLLCAERAVFYLNLLYGLLVFRRNHELEPSHDDLFDLICAAQSAAANEEYHSASFSTDIRQLEQWDLLSQRIERERLRGYKDASRRKYRYRMSDGALSFLNWLEDQLQDVLEPHATDTRDLLTEVAVFLRELKRTLNKVHKTTSDSESVRFAMSRLFRLRELTQEINRSVSDFNATLISFVSEEYQAKKATQVIATLKLFVDQYLHRISTLRSEIVPELKKLQSSHYQSRWELCRVFMERESEHATLLIRSRAAPDVARELASLVAFYDADGMLETLCTRVWQTSVDVLRKLTTHLREMERKSHRREDLRARIQELVERSGDQPLNSFTRELLSSAHMTSDMNFWNEDEKATPPQPRQERHKLQRAPVQYLKPKAERDSKEVRSMKEERLKALRGWVDQRYPALPATVSSAEFDSFADFENLIQLARAGLLGNGRDLKKTEIELLVEPREESVRMEWNDSVLSFRELMVSRFERRMDHE